jgi:hypothetical protein
MFVLQTGFVGLAVFAAAASAQTIGGFDLARGGAGSWRDGSWTANARSAVEANYTGVTFTGAGTLTTEYLNTLDLLILTSAAGPTSAIAPLSAGEQAALSAYIAGGGRAMIVSDNNTFNAGAPAANASLLAPVGVTAAGTLQGNQEAFMTLANNPVASGPFGSVPSVTLNFPGWLSSWTAGTPIAFLGANNEAAGLLIDQNQLGAGSGRVLVFSDTLWLDATPGTSNRTAFLNAFEWTLVPAPGAFTVLVGACPIAMRRRRAA